MPTCDQFKTRLAQAEDAIHRPIPAIKFSEETNLSPLVKSHEFDLVDVLGIEATLHCKSSGEFSDFTLEYDGIEKYAMQRVENLMIAATWAFTRWPPSQASASVEELFAKATANLKDDIIRGGKAASGGVRFFRGNADIGITNDVTISLDGSQINDGPFSTQFLIDASCAGGCDDK